MPARPYPDDYTKDIELSDGTLVTLRPIRPDDAPLLQEGFERLSAQSIYMRFLESFRYLPDDRARYFANVDYHTRMAIVATVQQEGREQLAAVARYDCLGADHPGAAEAAIIVGDEVQRLGLGAQIMQHLADYARDHGVRSFLGTISMSNQAIQRFIGVSGLPYEKKMLEPGVWEINVHLVDNPKEKGPQ